MRPFSLTWSNEINENEALVFVSTVNEAIRIAWEKLPPGGKLVPPPVIRPFGDWSLEGVDPEIDYANFQWYQDQTLDQETGNLRVDQFLDLILREPWQQESPHYDLSLLHQPLSDSSTHYTLGMAARGRAAVFSAHPVRELSSTWYQLMLLRRLTAHYVGQVLAVPIWEERRQAHCTNLCAMRPAKGLASLIALAEQETNAEILYCEQCQAEMGERLVGIHFGNN